MVNGHVRDLFSLDTEIPFIFLYLTTEMIILFSNCLQGLYFILCVCVCVCVCVCARTRTCTLCHVQPTFETLWTVAHPGPLSMEFPKQKYWSGLPFPSPGDLPDPGIKLLTPALVGGFLTTEPPGKPY